jgi:hypothetical protein
MKVELQHQLQELNQQFQTNCQLKFIVSEASYYRKGVITLGTLTKDPLWTLCHEFKHFLQDHRKNYIYRLRHKILKQGIMVVTGVALGYSLLFPYLPFSGVTRYVLSWGDMVLMAWMMINALNLSPPVLGSKRSLYRDLSHHLEFEADKFATQQSGVIPYNSQSPQDPEEDFISHPSWNSRIASLEAEFPHLKK